MNARHSRGIFAKSGKGCISCRKIIEEDVFERKSRFENLEISPRSRREEKEFIFEGIFEDLDDNYYEEREKDLINELR